MVEYHKLNMKLSDSKLNKLKSTVESQAPVTLRINIKMFNGKNLTS